MIKSCKLLFHFFFYSINSQLTNFLHKDGPSKMFLIMRNLMLKGSVKIAWKIYYRERWELRRWMGKDYQKKCYITATP